MDKKVISIDLAKGIKNEHDAIIVSKLQLADLELEYIKRKGDLLKDIEHNSAHFHRLIQSAAQHEGIADTGGKWKFNVIECAFIRE